MPDEPVWEPLDVQRIAKQAAESINAFYYHAKGIQLDDTENVENIIKRLMLDERAYFEKTLKNPVAVRINIMRGGIARPSDLVWLHDTDGPVAEKVRKAVEEQVEKDAQLVDAVAANNPEHLPVTFTASQAIRKQLKKRKK